MPKAQSALFLLFAVIQFLLGIFANGIILVGNIIGLVKERKLTPLDLLLSCLAGSRICLQSFLFYFDLLVLSLTQVPASFDIFVIMFFVNKLGLWLATWLGVFYCIKITTFRHPLFLWLKRRISGMVPWLVAKSLLYAAVFSGIYSKYTWVISQALLQKFSSKNATGQIKEPSALSFCLLIIGLSFPFLIFLIASLLLIFSLARHTWHMATSVAGTRDPGRSVHISALWSVLSFFILYFCHYSVALLLSSCIFPPGSLMFLLCLLISGSYSSGHSIILILGNPKLKRNAKRLLSPCDHFQEPTTG
ncbi:taste receptor type 2 member 1 [Ochotona princeps]|uniref:taste receptor type 2 member 1 n=1 Tax=Ochotona princeps TaxID=9978 RepID=UPI002714B838|nr:taste receptor type 2 member 1 [Ochotona princeps]